MGRVFYAIVVERHERELEVEPIDRRVTYRRVKAREVLGIWRKSRVQNGRVGSAVSLREAQASSVALVRSNDGGV